MPSLFLFLSVLLSLTSFIQAKGTKPPNNFACNSFDKPKRIDVFVETGSVIFANTDDRIRLLLRDSDGVVCTATDLDNWGDDHMRWSIDQYALCCPQNFAIGNASLSMLLLAHQRGHKGNANDWFVEHIEVRRNDFLLFEYRFHAWTNPYKVSLFGVSKVADSHSNDGKPSYSLFRV
jgi:hypothetical protein